MFCTRCGKEINDNAVICVHCGVMVKGFNVPEQSVLTVEKPEIPEDAASAQKKNANGFALSGFIVAIVSIVLGFLSVYINHLFYTGVNFQYFFAVPLAVALVLSIIGTVKAKKSKSGKSLGFGITGIVLSGGIFVLYIVWWIFAMIFMGFAAFFFMFILFALA